MITEKVEYEHKVLSNVFVIDEEIVKKCQVKSIFIKIQERGIKNLDTPFIRISYVLIESEGVYKGRELTKFSEQVFKTKQELLRIL